MTQHITGFTTNRELVQQTQQLDNEKKMIAMCGHE